MRKKAGAKQASQRGAPKSVTTDLKQQNTHWKLIKQTERPSNNRTGKGLGKAGAKRLGRLLKRAIQDQGESAESGPASLPKTPVRLFKHQIQTKKDMSKVATPQVSQLILSVVSQCKHRGGISMAELKQTLAAEGYDVTKNNRRVNVVTQRLVNNETLVQTTRNASFRLNKTQTSTRQVRTITVKPQKPKGELKKDTATRKSPKRAGKVQRVRATHKPRGRKTQKPTGRTRKTAARSNNERKKTSKNKRKAPKPAGKKRSPAKKKATRPQKAPKKTQRARQPKQTRRLYKSTPKRPTRRQKVPKTRPVFRQQRRDARRN